MGRLEHPEDSAGLFGRDRELGSIRAFVERIAQEDGGALLVFGEPGVGKTVLLDDAAATASAAGLRVARASGVEFEADLPFSALHQLLLPLHEELSSLVRPHRDALNAALGFGEGVAPDRMVISNATLTALRRSAVAHPLLVVIDDLPWLDRASAAVLGFVARRLAGSRVGLVGASRPGEGGFFETAGLPELELQPLDAEASRALLSVRFPTLAADVRERVLTEARGNPLALLELPATLSDSDAARAAGRAAVVPMSRRLEAVFASQIEAVPTAGRRLLLLAALDGTGDLRVLRALGQESDGLEELAALERARLVHVDPETHRLAFRHPLIRSAVVERSTEEERREAHARLAELFAEQPDLRVWHLAEATVGPDEEVAGLLEEAAHRIVRRGDAVGAVAALVRSSELSPSSGERSRRLAAAAYIGADVSGDLRRASELLADSRRADQEPGDSLQAAVTASHLLLNQDGDAETAHRLLVGAIESSGDPADGALGEALYTLMIVCFFGGRATLWEPFYAAVARLGAAVPPLVQLSTETIADPARTASGALERLDAEIERLTQESDPSLVVRLGLAGSFLDRLPGGRSALWRVVREGREGSAVASGLNAQMLLGREGFWTGDWDAARRLVDDAVKRCRAGGYVLLALPGRHLRALLAAAQGDYESAEAGAAELTEWAVPRRTRLIQTYAWHVRTLAALTRGDFEDAYRQASEISPAGTLASHVPYALIAQMDLVEAAVRTGRRREAAAHVAAIREAGIAALSSRLALLAGASAAIAAPDESAAGLFEEALAVPGVDRWPFDHARVQLLYGERLRRTRAVTESRAHLRTALETFERLGARPWAQRAANELRAAGETRKPPAGERDRDALTPQEREIASLAAAGLTNKQIGERLFLSHRTVGFHLHRVFPKLGISSRAALRDALASLPPDEDDSGG